MNRLLLSPAIVRFVLFAERWILSLLFLFLAYQAFDTLWVMERVSASAMPMPSYLPARDAAFLSGVHFADYARYGLLLGSNLFSGVLLLISQKPAAPPTRVDQVVVPMLGTFGYMIFNQYIAFPAWMTTPLTPASWAPLLAAAGLVSSLIGAVLALGSMLWLGRSLGIVVSVREIVTGGPYRYVRHPIYLGYFFVFAGLLMTGCTVRMLILAAGGSAILVWRARLEESMLCAQSAPYRTWRDATGFLWPRRLFANSV